MIITFKTYFKKLIIVFVFFLNYFPTMFFISNFIASISFVNTQFFAATQNFINA